MKVIILIFLSCIIANAQSTNELRQKYGAPTSETYSEVYQARTYNEKTHLSVSVTVTYTKSREISGLLVEISPYLVKRDTTTNKAEDELKTELLQEVVDEILPFEKRGKRLVGGFKSGGCSDDGCSGTFDRYEKVTIFYNANTHRYASIGFKDVVYK